MSEKKDRLKGPVGELGEKSMKKSFRTMVTSLNFVLSTMWNSLDDCKQGHAMISFMLLKDKSGISSYTYCVES